MHNFSITNDPETPKFGTITAACFRTKFKAKRTSTCPSTATSSVSTTRDFHEYWHENELVSPVPHKPSVRKPVAPSFPPSKTATPVQDQQLETQLTNLFSTHGKRPREEICMSQSKKHKQASTAVARLSVEMLDEQVSCYFRCYKEEQVVRLSEPFQQMERAMNVYECDEDCPTDLAQIQACACFLVDDLEQAFRKELGI